MSGKIDYTDVHHLMEHNFNIKNRIILIDDDINDKTVSKAIKVLLYLDELDSTKPIHIYINSFGGDVYDGLALYDVIRACRSQIYTYGLGKIMSMATYIYLAGDKRFLYERSTIMIHELSDINHGQLDDLKINLKEAERLQKILIDIYVKRTEKKTKKYWENLKKDTYFSAKESINNGLAHYLVESADNA